MAPIWVKRPWRKKQRELTLKTLKPELRPNPRTLAGSSDEATSVSRAIEPPLIAIHLVAPNETNRSYREANEDVLVQQATSKGEFWRRKASALVINDQNPASIGRVELVKRTFTGLVTHDTFQLTCLAASICSAINLALIGLFESSEAKEEGEAIQSNIHEAQCKSSASNPNQFDCVKPSSFLFRLVCLYGTQLAPVESKTVQFLFISLLVALIFVVFPFAILGQMSELQCLNRTLNASSDASRIRSKIVRAFAKIQSLASSIAVLLSLLLLQSLVHFFAVHRTFRDHTTTTSNRTHISNIISLKSFITCQPPAGATLTLFYVTPIALESSPRFVRILGLLAPLRLILCASMNLVTSDTKAITHNHLSVLLTSVPVAWAFGWLWCRRFRRCLKNEAFLGARRLIKAKVGLERQRQQQETLLLSVLPAYVAEQVKRNMLRQVEGIQQSIDDTSNALTSNTTPVPCVVSIRDSSNQPVTETLTKEHALGINRPNRFPLGVSVDRLVPNFGLNEASEQQAKTQTYTPITSTPQSVNIAAWASSGCLSGHSSPGRRCLNDLYIRTYNSVSLIYADIVGFTKLCSELNASQLVRILNCLFSHFDHLAERHKIMRIKILGDCYYGVSGIPNFAVVGSKSRQNKCNENHAINCVDMGLDMIDYIKRLNHELAMKGVLTGKFELNMRIGIHTGHIHSGVIGLQKWQFDVWSNDVSIAMHCESSGTAGRVQVTQATVQHIHGSFTYEPSQAGESDDFLSSNSIKTYLIVDRTSKDADLLVKHNDLDLKHKAIDLNQPLRKTNDESELNIRAATINTIRQSLLIGGEMSSGSGIQDARGVRLNRTYLTNFLLLFKDLAMQKSYSNRPLEVNRRKVGLLWLLSAVFLPALDLMLIRDTTNWSPLWPSICFCLSSVGALLLCYNPSHVEVKVQNCNEQSSSRFNINKNDSNDLGASTGYTSLLGLRSQNAATRIRLMASLLFLATFIQLSYIWTQTSATRLNHEMCNSQDFQAFEASILNHNLELQRFQLSVILALIIINFGSTLFSYEVHFFSLLILLIFHVSQLVLQPEIFRRLTRLKVACPHFWLLNLFLLDWSSWIIVMFAILLSLTIARQIEFVKKSSFLWRNQLNVDQEELQRISGINKILLENILPSHVVQYYLNQSSPLSASESPAFRRSISESEDTSSEVDCQDGIRCNELDGQISRPTELVRASKYRTIFIGEHLSELMLTSYQSQGFGSMRSLTGIDELYHEQHSGVAVMFGSIPHFHEFYDETDFSKRGLNCIALLHEIICDFDKLLSKNKFSRIEKIKTIGR